MTHTIRVFALCAFCAALLSGQSADTGAALAPSHSPGDVLNAHLPRWIRFSGEERIRLEGFSGLGFRANSSDTYALQRFRLGMILLPASWLKFGFQVQDARAFFKTAKPYGPPFQGTWDLRQAYVEFGRIEQGSVGLRAGRQELAFGDERLVGNTPWLNTSRSYDAVRLRLHHGKLRLDAFASSVVVLHDGQVGTTDPGNNLHGLYGGLDNVVPGATIEPYVFWRLAPRLKNERGSIANLDLKAVGLRWTGKLPHGFDYNTEMTLERGSLGADTIGAWAGHWLAGKTFAARGKPRVFAEFNYASGDANPKDGIRQTFDQLYPTAHDKHGLADQVGWKNIRDFRAGIEFKPRPKWMASLRYSDYWLSDAHDALYNAAGLPVAIQPNGSAGTWIGQEIDLLGAYAPAKQVQFGAGFSHIFPGTFLIKVTPGQSYNSPYLFATYLF